jgi:hypothetical protein
MTTPIIWMLCAIVVAVILGSFIRWFLLKPTRVKLPTPVFDELNRFASEFQKAADSMAELAKNFDEASRRNWKKNNRLILKNLQRMNRLLQQLNRFFADESEVIARQKKQKLAGEHRKKEKEGGLSGALHTIKELEKFQKMGKISEDEMKNTDWDELLKKLREMQNNGN